jgi:hypothetical protein
MKKIMTLLSVLFSATTFAQNVGIGETAPTAMKLQVKAADSAVALIQNSTALGSNIKTGLFFKTGNFYSGSLATVGSGATFRMGLFTYGGANPSDLVERISILDGGNVGIGTTTPSAKLEIAGTLKIADGTQGNGKVLTSDAAGNSSWSSAAYGNTERFQFRLSGFATPIAYTPIALTTIYNFGTATTTYTPGQDQLKINISKSGLYHFDINTHQVCSYDYSITSANATPQLTYFGVIGGPTLKGYSAYYKLDTYSCSSYDKAYEVYITAPAVFSITCVLTIPTSEYRMVVTGHLISQ